MAEWQWMTLAALVRLAKRFGQWPSMPELARELRCDPRWARKILEALREEDLVTLVGDGAACGWMPTGEGLRWRGLSMPMLSKVDVPPRQYRWAGVGAVRAWNRKQRLKMRLAARAVFDTDEPDASAIGE